MRTGISVRAGIGTKTETAMGIGKGNYRRTTMRSETAVRTRMKIKEVRKMRTRIWIKSGIKTKLE